jgi:acetyl esterase/lipase
MDRDSLVGSLVLLLAVAPVVAAQPPRPKPPDGTTVHADLEYVPGGHERQRLDLYVPAKADTPLPVIVWIHGGAWLGGSKDGGSPALPCVGNGYAVASINYRLSQHAVFPAQIEDCKTAIRWLRANAKTYNLNPDRIGVWGASAGGHLVALLGTSGGTPDLEGKDGNAAQSSRVQAVVDFFGPTDFLQMDAHAVPGAGMKHDLPASPESRLVGGAIQENVEKVRRANPITYVTKDAPPFLIVHGEQDPLVPCHQSELLYEALKRARSNVTFYKIAGAGHGGLEFNSDMMRAAVQAFFDKHLMPRLSGHAETPPQPKAPGLHAGGLLVSALPAAQDAKGGDRAKQPEFIPAGYNDYQNMLGQLGITKLRRGRDARVRDTSDEATANPYKDSMPELLTFKDGMKVTEAGQWPRRRAEIVEEFEREVYGRVPKNIPKITWEVTSTAEAESGGIATVTKTPVGHADNRGFPQIKVDIQARFTVPKHAGGRLPIILQFGFAGGVGGRGRGSPWTQQALEKGWAYGTINPNSIQGDNSRLREGIIGLTNKGEPRSPEDWGALRAWAWGVSRLIDYFEANPASGVDPAKVCITGVSRFGKAALVATAFETRIAAGFVASSGAGGAKLFRRDFGELLENLASGGGYHWMAGNFLKYAADEASVGRKTVADLPVDQHELIALCAPRLCFISYGVVPGDPNWVDAHGSFMAGVLAGPAYRLLGKKDLGTNGDYLTDKQPAVNALIGGELAWRQHDGGHTSVPNFPAFFDWAGRYIASPGLREKK